MLANYILDSENKNIKLNRRHNDRTERKKKFRGYICG